MSFQLYTQTSRPQTMHYRAWLATLLVAALFALNLRQTQAAPPEPVLVKDINPTGSSSPLELTNVNGTLFFRADDGSNGYELWKSDGTAAGTVLVKDIHLTGHSGLGELTNVNGALFFAVDDGVSGNELWKSDGTAAGTVQVKDIHPTGYSYPEGLTDVNGTLYFNANDGSNGYELWKSDGTADGTVLVKDIDSAGSSSPWWLTNVNGTLFFEADDGNNGRELWKSNGSADGTVLVKDIHSAGSSEPTYLTDVNGTLYFTADDGSNGRELWKSDGTTVGTVLVKDINPTGDSNPENITDVNGTLFFMADNGISGYELWKSDGTAGGTVLVKDINLTGSSYPDNLVNLNGTLFFSANDGSNGYELWKSDGTAAGTVLVKDIHPAGHSYPYGMNNINNTLYFRADDGSNGRELWQSDGTAAGTVLVKDVNPAGHFYPRSMTTVSDTLFFTADEGSNGRELWRFTPNTAPTITSINSASVPENGTGAIDVDATDDNDAESSGLTFSFSGGADDALFSIDASTGIVTFNSAPDFEASSDADEDNVYEIQVTVTDSGGLSAAQDITVSVTDVAEDSTPPSAAPTLDPLPNGAGWNNSDVTVTWNWADDVGGSGIDVNNCTSSSASNGEGTIELTATCADLAGNVGSESVTVQVDQSAPNTTINGVPSAHTPSANARFVFDGSDVLSGVADFECQLDGEGFSTCTSPQMYTDLPNGSHTFDVRAIDAANNVDPTPASHTWTVAVNRAPTITSDNNASVSENGTNAIDVQAIDDNDAEGGGLTFSLSGGVDHTLFSIDASTGIVTFNSAPDFEAPSDADEDNVYEIQVTVTDSGGLTAVQDITVTITDVAEDSTPPSAAPTLDPLPNGAGWNNSDVTVTWNWTDDVGGSGIDVNNCTSSSTSNGEGTIELTATCADLAANVGSESVTVQVDQSAPNTTINGVPSAHTPSANARFEFSGSDALSGVDGFECALDNGLTEAVTACSSPHSYAALENGTYTFTVSATDVAGNVDPTPASYTWTVDVPPANVAPTITSSNAASVSENGTNAIDVQAIDDNDAEGGGLTFSLSGGVDHTLFSIDASTGIVTFNSAPDFEAPSDADEDNVYEIQVTVTDSGGLTAVQDITVTITDVGETDVRSRMSESLGSYTYDPTPTSEGVKGTLTVSFTFTYNSGPALQNMNIAIHTANNAVVLNTDQGVGSVGAVMTIPNASLPNGNNQFDSGETLLVPFEIAIQDTPWGVNFDLLATELNVNSSKMGEPLNSFTIASSMFDLDALFDVDEGRLAPTIYLPLYQ